MKPVIIRTISHYYLYSPIKEEFLFLEKEFGRFLSQLLKQGIFNLNVKHKVSENNKNTILENITENKVNSLFIDKMKLLIDNNYLSSLDSSSLLNNRIIEEDITSNIANTGQITLELTENCNLQCVYCGYGEFYTHKDRANRKLKYENAVGIIDYVVKQWNSTKSKLSNSKLYIGFYGGEPLLRFDMIKKLVEYSGNKQLNRGNHIAYIMTTNGLLLDRYIDFFVEHDVKITVSLDGNEEHNRLRIFKNGKSSFKKVFENLQIIKKKYPEYFNKKIKINAVLHSENKVSDVTNFIKKSFDKIPVISALKKTDVKELFQEQFDKILSKNRIHAGWKNQSVTNDIKAVDFITSYTKNYENYEDVFKSTNSENYVPTATCTPFQLKLFVTADGKIQTCERIGSKNILGHIVSGNVLIDKKMTVEKYNNLFDRIEPLCQKCYRIKNCKQCIFKIDERNSLKIKCPQFMNRIEFEMEMTNAIKYMEKSTQLNSYIINNSVGKL